MVYEVIVKGLNPNIEDEIMIEVNGINLTCFAPFGFPELKLGSFYKADIGVTVLDDFKMVEVQDQTVSFQQVGNSFSYKIRGTFDLNARTIEAGIRIELDEDEFDLCDFGYLDGKIIELKVDRIKIDFID